MIEEPQGINRAPTFGSADDPVAYQADHAVIDVLTTLGMRDGEEGDLQSIAAGAVSAVSRFCWTVRSTDDVDEIAESIRLMAHSFLTQLKRLDASWLAR